MPHNLIRNRRAVSPAISTTILVAAIIAMLLVTVSFANNYLGARIAQYEYSAMKQFMQTVGLQVDDVAWIPGRTQTMRYASRYGQVTVQPQALNYTFYCNNVSYSYIVGAVMYSMPTSAYSVAKDYFERIFPSSSKFLQNSTTAPVCRVFAIQKTPMADGSYTRIVVAPIVRQMNSLVSNITYVQFYLTILEYGPSPQNSQTVTLTGTNVQRQTLYSTQNITIRLGYPRPDLGFTSDFFHFEEASEYINVTTGTVVEIYTGEVQVSLGLYG